MPGWIEHDVHGDVRLAERRHTAPHVLADLPRRRNTRGGEGHADGDLRGIDVDAIDQPEVIDVERDLRVVALADRRHDLRPFHRAAAVVHRGAGERAWRRRRRSYGGFVALARARPGAHA